ncbi:CLUMA_CG013748, isoform A [Clunio marinus]|uniref:CLUMA_CG013748, isoform A n=1 Tax=Clunio marinus TaxID=568069 RepID=A0A1J1IJR8_9DIPT|nr:CLUMA_CG013748, isoform A [Clunio marinus]
MFILKTMLRNEISSRERLNHQLKSHAYVCESESSKNLINGIKRQYQLLKTANKSYPISSQNNKTILQDNLTQTKQLKATSKGFFYPVRLVLFLQSYMKRDEILLRIRKMKITNMGKLMKTTINSRQFRYMT